MLFIECDITENAKNYYEENKMKIVLLAGNHSTGKTTTLNLVYDQLILGMKNPPPKAKIQFGSPSDFESSPLLYNKKTVAIFSLGDILYRIYDAIIKYCGTVDVLIIACRTGGTEFNALVATVQGCPQHQVIYKTPLANNNADCQTIINSI